MNPAAPGSPDNSTEVISSLPPIAATEPIVPGATPAVSEDVVRGLFSSGSDFNQCLRKTFPMTSEEIEAGRATSGLPLGTETQIHTALARTKLRQTGLYSKARLVYIEKKKAQCLERAEELKRGGNWRNMSDAASYLLNEEQSGFAKECEPLFDIGGDPSTQKEEQTQYEVFRETLLFPLRDQLDAMFAPLHAVMHLKEVEKYLSNSKDGLCGPNDHNVGPFDGLRRFTSSLKRAREKHKDDALQTYFSATVMPADGVRGAIETPQITFLEAEKKAKELAKVLIRTMYKESQQRKTEPTKEAFITKVEAGLKDTGFSLENCGFTFKDITTGWFKKTVVGYELVEQK